MSEVGYYLVKFFKDELGNTQRDYDCFTDMNTLLKEARYLLSLPESANKPTELRVQIETVVEFALPDNL